MSLPNATPVIVIWLGYGGLLPFLALMAAVLIDPHHRGYWAEAHSSYAALILSFVAAFHWAFAMTLSNLSNRERNRLFVWSVVPPLVGWLALLLPPLFAYLLLASGFVTHYRFDRRLARQCEELPAWYLPLRLRLTSVASLSLLGAALALRHG
jgi:hypothetical protein